MLAQNVVRAGLLTAVLLGGCASYRVTAEPPYSDALPRPVRSESVAPPAASDPQLDGPLTMQRAYELALAANPAIAAAHLEIRAAEARARQAGALPNPEAGVEFENFAGSGPFREFGGMETTVAVSQPLLTGGKRRKDIRRAILLADLAAWDLERARLDLNAEVHNAVNLVLIAQEDVALKRDLVALAERLRETTAERVAAGKISPAEAARAEVVLAQNRIALNRALRHETEVRQRLAATWGDSEPRFSRVVGDYEVLFDLPPLDSLRTRLDASPDLARYPTAIRQREAAIAAEDARAIPDPTLSGGVRHIRESGDVAFLAGLSIPIPLANRNRGGREAARRDLEIIRKEFQAVRIRMERDLSRSFQRALAARSEVQMLRDTIIPQAEIAYARIREGYLQGRFDFLDVLDAQKTLFDSNDRYLHALREYHAAAVAIERLIAEPLH